MHEGLLPILLSKAIGAVRLAYCLLPLPSSPPYPTPLPTEETLLAQLLDCEITNYSWKGKVSLSIQYDQTRPVLRIRRSDPYLFGLIRIWTSES
jgi:hypothetical protein